MSLRFYSQKIDESLAATVRRIAGQHDRFATDMMTDPKKGPVGDTWLEAWEDPQTRRWLIDCYTRISGEIFHKEEISTLGVCFFDTLEYCGKFISSER